MRQCEPDTDGLLELCRKGDPQARDRLFERHRDRLRRMVASRLDRRLVDRFGPSDVVQDALTEAAQRLPAYLEERPMFYPWLRRLAWDRLVELQRKHVGAARRSVRREQLLFTGTPPDESVNELAQQLVGSFTSPSGALIREEVIRHVRDCLDGLSPADGELLLLRHVEQLSVRQTAEVLDISEGAVKTRHFRAIQRLHALLGEDPRNPGSG